MKQGLAVIGFLVGFVAPKVLAAIPGVSPCAYIGGCNPENVLANAVPVLANLFIGVAAGAAVVFVIVGAFLMLISLGEEGQIQKGKMAIIYALVGLGITLLAQSIVAFLGARFAGLFMAPDPLVAFMSSAVALMVSVFNSVFILMIVFAGFRMVFAQGKEDEFNKARSMMIWAAIGAIVVNIARALVNAVLVISL